MIRRDDIIWLGGLLEGEGHFGLSEGKYPIIGLGMTAEDTVTKVAIMWDREVYHWGNMWRVRLCGVCAIGWMMTLYPYLGRCRKDTIIEIVKFWREYSYRVSNSTNGIKNMAKCHPDRIVAAFDMCRPCYNRQYYIKKRLLKEVG